MQGYRRRLIGAKLIEWLNPFHDLENRISNLSWGDLAWKLFGRGMILFFAFLGLWMVEKSQLFTPFFTGIEMMFMSFERLDYVWRGLPNFARGYLLLGTFGFMVLIPFLQMTHMIIAVLLQASNKTHLPYGYMAAVPEVLLRIEIFNLALMVCLALLDWPPLSFDVSLLFAFAKLRLAAYALLSLSIVASLLFAIGAQVRR